MINALFFLRVEISVPLTKKPKREGAAGIQSSEIRTRLRADMPHLKERFAVETLGIFGSWARGQQTRNSDVDLLVTFTEVPGLFDYAVLERHLSEISGLPVDIGRPSELKDFAKPQAEREVQWL